MSVEKLTPQDIKDIQSTAKLVISPKELNEGITTLSEKLNKKFADKNPICVCVMTGGLFVTAGVLNRLKFPLQMDYVHVSRYHGSCYGQTLQWLRPPSIDPYGRDVIIFDDILDGGITLAEVSKYFMRHGANVTTVVLLDKKVQREKGGLIRADYSCFQVEDAYVFGYGLDYHGYLRNAPGIYGVPEEYIRKFR